MLISTFGTHYQAWKKPATVHQCVFWTRDMSMCSRTKPKYVVHNWNIGLSNAHSLDMKNFHKSGAKWQLINVTVQNLTLHSHMDHTRYHKMKSWYLGIWRVNHFCLTHWTYKLEARMANQSSQLSKHWRIHNYAQSHGSAMNQINLVPDNLETHICYWLLQTQLACVLTQRQTVELLCTQRSWGQLVIFNLNIY